MPPQSLQGFFGLHCYRYMRPGTRPSVMHLTRSFVGLFFNAVAASNLVIFVVTEKTMPFWGLLWVGLCDLRHCRLFTIADGCALTFGLNWNFLLFPLVDFSHL